MCWNRDQRSCLAWITSSWWTMPLRYMYHRLHHPLCPRDINHYISVITHTCLVGWTRQNEQAQNSAEEGVWPVWWRCYRVLPSWRQWNLQGVWNTSREPACDLHMHGFVDSSWPHSQVPALFGCTKVKQRAWYLQSYREQFYAYISLRFTSERLCFRVRVRVRGKSVAQTGCYVRISTRSVDSLPAFVWELQLPCSIITFTTFLVLACGKMTPCGCPLCIRKRYGS